MTRLLTPCALIAALLISPEAARCGPSSLMTTLLRLASPAVPPATSSYTVIDLGTLGGASEAFAISENGKVAGMYTPGAYEQAFLWEDGVMQGLGTLGGARSQARGVNDAGQVVGYSLKSSGYNHAFLWQNGTMIDLGTLSGGEVSMAFAINNAGQVVGQSDTAAYKWHAFRWSGGMADLGALGGGHSFGYGINESGAAVGASTIGVSPDITDHATRWSGGMQDLGTGGWAHSRAYGMNDNGQVVGRLALDGYPVTIGAFLYDGGMQALGGTQSTAWDINNDGLIVGESDGQAILWENGQMKNLNSLIDPTSGWTLQSARAINETGKIVGKGSFNGATRAFLLSPSYHWINPNGGAWSLKTNWDPQGVPGKSDTAEFALSGQYAVNTSAKGAKAPPPSAVQVGRLIVSGANIVDFTYFLLNLLDDSVDDPALTVNDAATVKITSGVGDYIHAIVGGKPPKNPSNPDIAHLQVFNQGTMLRGTGRLTVGDEGPGDVFVANGAELTSAEARLGGLLTNATGTAVVGGDGSLWQTGSIAVGYGEAGTLTIENGGSVNSNDAFVGFGAIAEGSYVTIDGLFSLGPNLGASWTVTGDLVIGRGSSGWVEVRDGGQLAVSNNLYLASGAESDLFIHGRNAAGTPSGMSIAGSLFVGHQTGTGFMQVRNGASVDIASALVVGQEGIGDIWVTSDSGILTKINVDGPQGYCRVGLGANGSVVIEGNSVLRCRFMVLGLNISPAPQLGRGDVILRNGGKLEVLETLQVGENGGGGGGIAMQNALITAGQGIFIAPIGAITGSGTLEVGFPGLVNDGTLSPGINVVSTKGSASSFQFPTLAQAGDATMSVSGALTMGTTSRLKIRIGGNNPGQYGNLVTAGLAKLNGELELIFNKGYAPKKGDRFTFLTAHGGVSGSFTNIKISGLKPGFNHNITPVGDHLVLEALNDGAPLQMEFDVAPPPDGDGKIDALDLVEWLNRIQSGPQAGDMILDFARFWKN